MNQSNRDLWALFIIALLIRMLAALPQQQPNYMDAAYSYVNALNLVAGRGFVEDFVWNYLNAPPPPPHPSHLYWMPLTSMLAAVGMFFGGVAYRAAQIPFVILSALLAPISYGYVKAFGGSRWQGWLAALFAIFSGFYAPFWTAIDNFTPFAIAGSLALLLAWRGLTNNHPSTQKSIWLFSKRSEALYLLFAGVCAGLAHLARADGPLVLITIILIIFIKLRPPTKALGSTLSTGLGYLAIMLPWLIRNWQVAGTPLPTVGSQTIWLTTYDQLFSYGRLFSAQTFFSAGLDTVVAGRWWAIQNNVQTVIAVWGMIFLTPLTAIGGWTLRRHLLVQLVTLYGFLLFLALTFVFAFPGARGGLFHSGTALLPLIYALSAFGLDDGVDWVAARRRGWQAPLAKQVFAVGLVIFAMALTGAIYYQRVLRNNIWNRADLTYPEVAAWVAQKKPEAMVMIGNPPAYRYHGGGLSVVVPNEPIDITLEAAARYGVDYLVLDPNRPLPLAEIYEQSLIHPQVTLVQTFGGIYIFEVGPP